MYKRKIIVALNKPKPQSAVPKKPAKWDSYTEIKSGLENPIFSKISAKVITEMTTLLSARKQKSFEYQAIINTSVK